ncbi:MAG: hypothetical protein JW795_17320 [Chitinivibrionales bacterium]|nr:hypothetical protein [Chitinivibrionales bacterium]
MKTKLCTIAIAQIPLGFVLGNRQMFDLIQKRYHGFLSTQNPKVTIHCTFYRSHSLTDTGTAIVLDQLSESRWHIRRQDFDCQINGTTAAVSLNQSIYSFDAFLRVLFSLVLPLSNTLLVHCSGLTLNSYASLFVGASGCGKSTIARLGAAANATILNDEICAVSVKKKSGGATTSAVAYATPFWGEMRSGPTVDGGFRIAGIYFLHQSSTTKKEALSVAQRVRRLLECVCVFGESPMVLQAALDLASEITSNTDGALLLFEKNSLFMHQCWSL